MVIGRCLHGGCLGLMALLGLTLPRPAQAQLDAAPGAPPALTAEGDRVVESAVEEDPVDVSITPDGLVEMHSQNLDLYLVLQQLLLKTRRNIVFGKDVGGTVTVSLYNVTLAEALDAILRPNGYTYREQGNFIYIYTKDQFRDILEDERQIATRTYRLNYVSAVDAEVLLAPFLTPQIGRIVGSAPKSGGGPHSLAIEDLVIVQDYEDALQEIEHQLRLIDTRPKQVLVEATIVRASLNESNALGIDFNFLDGVDFELLASATGQLQPLSKGPNLPPGQGGSDFGELTNLVPFEKLNDVTFGLTTSFARNVPSGGLSLGVVTDDVSIFLRALESVSDVVILANPKVPTLNKQPAHILVGSRDGYLTTSVTTETSTTQSVDFLETGTQLEYVPYISNDGYVRLEITPSDSTGGVDARGLPFERTTEVTTNILCKDGHTLLIGGLFREAANTGRSQIPFLGSLPVVGPAFRSTSDASIREEVIILLTVHIIDDQSEYARYSGEALDDVERLRVGIRESMQFTGRERLAQANYHTAVDYATAGNWQKALWHAKLAVHNRPTFLDAAKLRDEIMMQRHWDDDGAATRGFLRNLIHSEGPPDLHFGRPPRPRPADDQCRDDPQKTVPGLCGCGIPDGDRDGDGALDCHDACPDDPQKFVPGARGCGIPEAPAEAPAMTVGFAAPQDGCPDDPDKSAPGLCGCGVPDTDRDADGAPDCHDGCPDDATRFQPGESGCGATLVLEAVPVETQP